jgi:hypothetical protein
MGDFSDLMAFTQTHRACGGLTPAIRGQFSGGYLLTLTCACGATSERRLSAEEAAHGPFATAVPAAGRPRRPDRPRPAPSPELERAMREALEAEDAVTSAPERQGSRIVARPELDAVPREAIGAEEAAATPSPSRPSPSPPAAAPGEARKRAAPSLELEAALRRAVGASHPELEPRKPGRKSAVPTLATSNVEKTVRAALAEQQRLRGALATATMRQRPKSRTLWFVLASLAVLAGAGAAVYVADTPEPGPPLAVMSSTALPGVAPARAEPGTYGNAMIALRRVQAASVPTISLPAYEAQIGVAQAAVGRYLEGDAPQDVKRNVRAILDLHLLAVAAWRLRAVDTPQAWAPVSGSPVLELCAPVRSTADFAQRRRGEDSAQARGRAIALAIPLLWECASTRLAQLDAAR